MNILPSIVSGDTAIWCDNPVDTGVGAPKTSDANVLTYLIAGDGEKITLTAEPNGNGWRTTLGKADSAKLTPGIWWWQAVITGNDERFTVGRGEITVVASLEDMALGYDGRSLAEKALADAEEALACYAASKGAVKSYTIGSRTMTFNSPADIIQLISFWRMRVGNERAKQQIAQGLGNPRRLSVRFQ